MLRYFNLPTLLILQMIWSYILITKLLLMKDDKWDTGTMVDRTMIFQIGLHPNPWNLEDVILYEKREFVNVIKWI